MTLIHTLAALLSLLILRNSSLYLRACWGHHTPINQIPSNDRTRPYYDIFSNRHPGYDRSTYSDQCLVSDCNVTAEHNPRSNMDSIADGIIVRY